MAQASSSKAKALALAMTGIAAVASFPTAAEAFTQRQCDLIQVTFLDHAKANLPNYSTDDKAQFSRFNTWLANGCARGEPIVLVRRPEVGAALSVVQMFVNKSPDPSLRVNLSPTVSFVPYETAAVRPTEPQGGTAIPISVRPAPPGG